MKLQNNKGQFKLTLPKDIVKSKKWKQGTELLITMNEKGEIVIKEMKR
ncbi:hypothetical protein GF336_03355 [Candidatus Woesearchaeota archaeon]|nr:hypothetical protein [Candidatus Woesearchaeota archaeon]